MRQLEIQSSNSTLVDVQPSSHPATFDVSKTVPLVPVFRESEVETYFGLFERVAVALKWPLDVWALYGFSVS